MSKQDEYKRIRGLYNYRLCEAWNFNNDIKIVSPTFETWQLADDYRQELKKIEYKGKALYVLTDAYMKTRNE